MDDIFTRLDAYFELSPPGDNFAELIPATPAEGEIAHVPVPLPDDGYKLNDLTDFTQRVLGFGEWVDSLKGFPLLNNVYLTRLEADFGNKSGGLNLSGVLVGFQWSDFKWEPVPGIVLEQPGLMVSIIFFDGDTHDSVLTVYGTIEVGGLAFTLMVSPTLKNYHAFLNAGSTVKLKPLLQLFHLDGLGFDDAEITQAELSGELDPASMMFHVKIEDGVELNVGDVELTLTTLDVLFKHFNKPVNFTAAAIGADFVLNESITLNLTADYAGADGGWDLSGSVDNLSIDLKIIAKDIAGKFKIQTPLQLPPPVGDFQITSLAMTLNTRTKAATFSARGQTKFLDTEVDVSVNINLSPGTAGGYDVHFDGQLTIASREFDIIFDKGSTNTALIACYSNSAGDTVKLSELIAAVTSTPISGADSVSFTLKDGLVALDTVASSKKYLLAVDMDTGVELSGLGNLPLIGQALGGQHALALSFQILAGTAWAQSDMKKVSGLIPTGGPQLPDHTDKAFQLITKIKAGDETFTLDGLGPGQPENTASVPYGGMGSPAVSADGNADPAQALASSSNNVHWLPLQKQFGPLSLSRIGVGYTPPKVDVLLDASFAIGPLSLSLDGLGAEYDLHSKQLTFTLRGGALAFEKGALTLTAAFLRTNGDFAGLGRLRFNELGITVLGAIGEVQGHPSFFIYAAIDYPLGGPAFFFVEGLALGFGVNRRLLMPPVAEVSTFPLVAAALGGAAMPSVGGSGIAAAVTDELGKLEKYVPPMLGEYFFAVGVKFTSFKLIRAFALLAMSVGEEFELDILGIATLTQPPVGDVAPDAPVMVRADLGLMARFVPDDGLLAVEAQLMGDSYLYDPRCHLVGGFAYYNWFSGEHGGDFVVTLGGYHPQFKPPGHYPQSVPRLGFDWQVTSEVRIKGGAYFALTPNAAMAGGFLSATYDGNDVSAWFNCAADFLMYWKPFHYQASASVEIGAALTVHCFGTHHVTITAGAELDIWGPRFTGRAHVHVKVLSVRVHFTVDFGDSSQNAPPKLSWDEFQKAFLPDVQKVCSVSVARGLVRTVSNSNSSRWIINPKELVLVTDSLVPSNVAGHLDANKVKTKEHDTLTPATKAGALGMGNGLKFGIEPMGTSSDHLTSVQTIRVRKKEKEDQWGDVSTDFIAVPMVKAVPRALWSVEAGPTSSPGLNDKQTTAALTGYELHPAKPPTPGASRFVEDSKLAYDINLPVVQVDATCAATYPPVTPAASMDESKLAFATALKASAAARGPILDDLGFSSVSDVSLDETTLFGAFLIPPQVQTLALATLP